MAVRREPDKRWRDFLSVWVDYNRGIGQMREWFVKGLTLRRRQAGGGPVEVEYLTAAFELNAASNGRNSSIEVDKCDWSKRGAPAATKIHNERSFRSFQRAPAWVAALAARATSVASGSMSVRAAQTSSLAQPESRRARCS